MNLEYLLVDSRTFSTNEEGALKTFFGSSVDSSTSYRMEIEVREGMRQAGAGTAGLARCLAGVLPSGCPAVYLPGWMVLSAWVAGAISPIALLPASLPACQVMTARLVTVFATLREMPAIRFRAAAPPGEEFPPGLESRLLVAQRVAVELHERLAALQRSGLLPERETCELILTDRGFDPVAPVIHEWTYEAMTHDLLGGTPALKDNVFLYEAQTQGGEWCRGVVALGC